MNNSGNLTPIIFGTDGWRGIIGTEMTHQSITAVAIALSAHLQKKHSKPTIAVGYDGRRLSQQFARTFSFTAAHHGVEVSLSHELIPTPILSHFTKENQHSAGVMITASHNPPEYNGIKFKGPYGGPYSTEETKEIEELLGTIPARTFEASIHTVDMFTSYQKHLQKLIDFRAIMSLQGTVVIDSMGGAGGSILETILADWGVKAITVNSVPDQEFSGRIPEPIEKNLSPLSDALTRTAHPIIGIATDGDADRCGVMLEDGKWFSAQETIVLLADYYACERALPGSLVKTSSVTSRLGLLAQETRRPLREVQVGFKYICDVMRSETVCFGGEESGGFGFGDHLPDRDGIFSGLVLLELLAKKGFRSIKEAAIDLESKYGKIHYERIDAYYPARDRIAILPDLVEKMPPALAGFEVESTTRYLSSRGIVNGLKIKLRGDARWILIRASETEPIIRFYAEGESESEPALLLEHGKKILGITI